jgi:apolipoprotein N-acyltransferase
MRESWGQIGLVALSVVLLSLAFAPFGQFYLAWIALVPWLIVVMRSRGSRAAFLWGWTAGTAFFGINLAWMSNATIPGTIAACIALGLSWGLVAIAIRLVVTPQSRVAWSVFFIAAAWCAGESLRAWAVGGFSWLLLGHSQSRLTPMCQIADALGVYGVSFWVIAINALIAISIHVWRDHPENGAGPCRSGRTALRNAIAMFAAMLVLIALYGFWRMHQANVLSPGPRVMVVQSNIAYARGGVPSAQREEIVERHLILTQKAFTLSPIPPDLIVFPEAMMPPLNPEARRELHRAAVGPFLERTHQRLESFATSTRGGLITGGYYVGGWKTLGKARVGDDRRNAAFFYTADGAQSASRYDKIELVPFAESMPWPGAPGWIRAVMLWLAAPSAREPDTPGDANALTVFEIQPGGARFVTPICFENVDAPFVARMLRGISGPSKRADFIVNLTNDGWFWNQEHAQHEQAIVFRAIENRVPIARASNTGISGFVDSLGRLQGTLAPQSEGTLTRQLLLDRRNTLYTRFGDAFAILCLVATAITTAVVATKRIRRR